MSRSNGVELENMAFKWSASTKKLASIADSTMKSVKEQEDIEFWKDCKLDDNLDIFQHTEPEMPAKKLQATDTRETLPREPPAQIEYNEPRIDFVPGTQILWDFVNNEPVDMVVYEN